MKLNYISLAVAFLFIAMIGFGSSEIQSIPPVRQGDCANLFQSYGNSSWQNISTIQLPDKTLVILNKAMTSLGGGLFNYTFCSTSQLGDYIINGLGDKDGLIKTWQYILPVTESGESFTLTQSLMLLGQLGLIGLFFGIGITFSRDKWKLKTFFFMAALLMGAVFLNSIRIIIGTSSSLSKMGGVGLILGIIVTLFMFLYLFIYSLIEVFQYFREKRRMKWSVGNQP